MEKVSSVKSVYSKKVIFYVVAFLVMSYILCWLVFFCLLKLEGPSPYYAWRLAIVLYPWNARFHYNLGEVYRDESGSPVDDQARAARGCYKRAVELDPSFAQAYFRLGWTYWVTHDKPAAQKYFTKAIILDPRLEPEVKDVLKINY